VVFGVPTSILSAQRPRAGYPRFEIPATAKALPGATVPDRVIVTVIAIGRPIGSHRAARWFSRKC
jgi:hypothetical protein